MLSNTFSILLALGLGAGEEPTAKDLIAHWPLQKDAKDIGPHQHHAENHGIKFADKAAVFDGRGAHLTVPAKDALQLGKRDFSLAMWVHTAKELDDDLGDLLSWYDPARRRGFHLSLRCNTGVTHSQANYRQLQFGIDDGSEPQWRDEGRPGKSVYGMSMAVCYGGLRVGTCEPGKDEAGGVYRYSGPGKWQDYGSPDRANAISAMATFEGNLYVGSAKYRLGGSSLPDSENPNAGGKIFHYSMTSRGNFPWIEVGQLPDCEAVGGMVVFRGKLYASSLYKPAGFFRYEGAKKWTPMPLPNGKRVEAMTAFNGYLWATSYDEAHVYRFDGKEWTDLGQVGEKENTQTYAFAIYQGHLCVSTWRTGKVFRWLDDKKTWEDMGRLGEEFEVMGMLVHNGQLYAGTLPSGDVYRYQGGTEWKRVGQLDQTPKVRYRRVWTMAQYRGRLFCTTLPSGKVHSLHTGPCVTDDLEFRTGWRYVTAVRSGDRLRLYIDGEAITKMSAPFDQNAASEPFDPKAFDLTLDQPLRIGAGQGDYFNGMLSDVRLYSRALTEKEIQALAKAR